MLPPQESTLRQLLAEIRDLGRFPNSKATDQQEKSLATRLDNFKRRGATQEQQDELTSLDAELQWKDQAAGKADMLMQEIRSFGRMPL